MKRITLLILTLAIIFCLGGCAPSGYLNSTSGDITVSLPETNKENVVLNQEEISLLGKWNLISITAGQNTETYEDSYYAFSEKLACTAQVEGIRQTGDFYIKDGVLYIWGKPLNYVLDGENLTLTDSSLKVHTLKKVPGSEPNLEALNSSEPSSQTSSVTE